jgi:arylsulfatase A-like enzyme
VIQGVRPPRRLLAAIVLALTAGTAPAQAWGFRGHRLVNARAVDALPAPLRALFAGNRAYLAEHAIDPDLWRDAGQKGENPNHYLNLDAFGAYPFAGIHRSEAGHLAQDGADAAAKGRLPWRVGEVYGELVAAFRARDMPRALERAAVLGHYVGDAHVPLHAALDHDGRPGQKGVHARWETTLVDRMAASLERSVHPGPATRVGDPVALTLDVLRQSFLESRALLVHDAAAAGTRDIAGTPQDERYDDVYFSRLELAEGARVRDRLQRAAQVTASLWLSAWEDAGRPALDTTYRVPYVRGRTRGILLSLDGASATVIDDAVARGVMPALARLRAEGATARGSLPALPSKTAPGHAALFTGAWSDTNGIGGNSTPLPGGSVLDANDGFDSTRLAAEPLWATAARQGLAATVAQGAQVYPFAPYLGERRFGGGQDGRLTLFDGFESWRDPHRVYRAADLAWRSPNEWTGALPAHAGATRAFTLTVAGRNVDGLLYDDPKDPVAGYDTLLLTLDEDAEGGVTLKPTAATGDASAFRGLRIPVGGSEATVFFRLFALAPDGTDLLLFHAGVQLLHASRPGLAEDAYERTAGFVGTGADELYEQGALGPVLWAGGDGTAERRYLETEALNLRQVTRLTELALDHTDWSLLVAYVQQPDEALHLWLGRLDPHLPSHDPALAARLRPYLDDALRLADGLIAHIAARAGLDTFVAVGGDHGMVGAERVVRPNVVLARAGLLALDAQGRLDLARSRIVYPPANAGVLLVNGSDRRFGIVPLADQADVRRAAAAALLALRDPVGGGQPIVAVRDAHEPGPAPGIGGLGGGDLYLTLAPGYQLAADDTGDAVGAGPVHGVHLGDPERPEMQVAFVVSGAGVARGADLGSIQQVDIAPTLCALLGIDPPAQATGRVLTGALAHPPASR